MSYPGSKLLLTVGYIFLLIALGACTPNAVTYYRPSMNGGKIVVGTCVPTERRLDFSLGDLQISAIANTVRNEVTVLLSLDPLLVKKVHFTSDQFQIYDIEKGRRLIHTSVFASRRDGVKSPSIPFPSGGFKPLPMGFNFSVYISFPGADIESFELVSPPIIIDGTERIFPVIRFQRKTWVGISPLNC